MSYIGTQPLPELSKRIREGTLSEPSQIISIPTGYTPGNISVTINGVRLKTSDYVATDGFTIDLGEEFPAGTDFIVEEFRQFIVADHYTKAEVDEKVGEVVSSGWELVASETITAPVTNIDFTDLEEYRDIMVVFDKVTAGSSQFRSVRVSVDNGSTFLTTGYESITATDNQFFAHNSSATGARSGFVKIYNFNQNTIKPASNAATDNNNTQTHHSEVTPFDAVQVINDGGGTLTGGSVFVFGRK